MKTQNVIQIAAIGVTISTLVVIGCGGALNGSDASSNQSRGDICGTTAPSPAEMLRVEAELAAAPTGRGGGDITIPVYVHVITNNTGVGDVSETVIAQQISILNTAFAGQDAPGGFNTSFRFQFVSTDRTANTAWWVSLRDSPDEVAMKTALRQGSADDLNLYIRDLPGDLLGYGGFPWWYAGAPHMDGPVIDYTGVPGGSNPNFAGDLAVHEVGHWLGLYHTFQDGCSKKNDFVNDTPAQKNPTWGCPTGTVNTCTAGAYPGNDPTMNFMDYTVDPCKYQFTTGQSARMDSNWTTYRAGR